MAIAIAIAIAIAATMQNQNALTGQIFIHLTRIASRNLRARDWEVIVKKEEIGEYQPPL
tara:strand:- start:876 stop:1052 length:177 start_codon:yes stop_codon:yes gene_type:complete